MTVLRNDNFEVEQLSTYDRIVLSPGPGLPNEAGKMMDVLQRFSSEKKILGICLGMQAIAEHFGGTLSNLPQVHHGVEIPINVIDANEPLFFGLPDTFKTGRYHSWVVNPQTLPSTLKITSVERKGEIMSLTHENQLVRGVQFHPESILTEWGSELISNWLYKC